MKRICFLSLTVIASLTLAAVAGSAMQPQSRKEKVIEKVIKTDKGSFTLKYVDLVEGKGTEAKSGNPVEVHYTGWLVQGKKFDSSVDRKQPFKFTVGAGMVIKGWDEGVAGMKEGGKRRLTIPPELAYGNKDVGGGLIPPNSTLIFEVELLKVAK
jgi:FKBP-type peptidyl-prolyl cis-trans isomerase